MKKFTIALVVAALVLAFAATSVFAGYTFTATMYGGQTENRVGAVKIWNDADSLNLEFKMRGGEGWCMEAYHVHAGLTFDDFPTNPAGNLIPGQFDYTKDFGGCVTHYLLEIPLSDLAALGIDPGDAFYLMIHTVVYNRYTGQQETGWTVRCGCLDGQQFPQNAGWAGYVIFTPEAWYLFP